MLKLIAAIALVVLTALLTGYNLENRSDIWIFHTFKDVPVFFAVLAAFIAGVLAAIPLAMKFCSGKHSSGSKKKHDGPVDYDAQEKD